MTFDVLRFASMTLLVESILPKMIERGQKEKKLETDLNNSRSKRC